MKGVGKILLVIGGCIIVLVIALVAVALFYLQKSENERNRARTQPARDAKASKKDSEESKPAETEIQQTEIVNPPGDETVA